MTRIIKRFTMVAVLGSLLSIAFAVPAQATVPSDPCGPSELCSPDGKIRLETLGTSSSPYMAPQRIRIKIPNGEGGNVSWCQPTKCGSVPYASTIDLGSPGGLATYEGILDPDRGGPSDGTLSIQILTDSGSWTFTNQQVLAPATGLLAAISKKGVGSYALNARRPVKVTITLWLSDSSFGGRTIKRRTVTSTITGSTTVTARIKKPKRRCSHYRHCYLLMTAQSWVDGYGLDFQQSVKRIK